MKKRILVVDDDSVVAGLLKEVLEKSNYKVDISNCGNDCLKKIKKDSYSLILLDIMMPGMSGEELAKLIKKKGENVPMVFVTIKPKNEVDISLVNGFIQKPFKNKNILDMVNSLV